MWIGINLHYNIYNIQGALFFRNQKNISLCNLLEENICNYHLYGKTLNIITAFALVNDMII